MGANVQTTVGSAFGRTMILGLALMISAPVLAQNKDLRLLDAVQRRDQKTFTSLIRAKADLNATRPDGATALAWAIHLGQRSMAEALLDAGAKANTVDEYGETPLTLAAANGDGLLVQRLRSEEHTSELQSQSNLVCRLLLEKKKKKTHKKSH